MGMLDRAVGEGVSLWRLAARCCWEGRSLSADMLGLAFERGEAKAKSSSSSMGEMSWFGLKKICETKLAGLAAVTSIAHSPFPGLPCLYAKS